VNLRGASLWRVRVQISVMLVMFLKMLTVSTQVKLQGYTGQAPRGLRSATLEGIEVGEHGKFAPKKVASPTLFAPYLVSVLDGVGYRYCIIVPLVPLPVRLTLLTTIR